MTYKLLIMAGGSGGHVFPALAIAEKLKQQDWDITWLGAKGRFEEDIIPKYGINIDLININGIAGKGVLNLIKTSFKFPYSILQAIRIIRKEKPDIILSMGGFCSAPGGIAAKLLGIPLILHEQNASVGITNSILSKISNQNLTAFPNVIKGAVVVGQPLRKEFNSVDNTSRIKRYENYGQSLTDLSIVVLGGSQGAQIINNVLPETLKRLQNDNIKLNIIHQTGKNKILGTKLKYDELGIKNVTVVEFIDDIVGTLNKSDIAICRSGALTVFENAICGLPSIFIPFNHKDKQQLVNAQYLYKDKYDNLIIEESKLNPNFLYSVLKSLNGNKLKDISLDIINKATPIATIEISQKIINIAEKEHK